MGAPAKVVRRLRRKRSIRGKVRGTAVRPRMTVFKSNRYTYVQVIDDDAERTVVAVSNREAAVDVLRVWRSSPAAERREARLLFRRDGSLDTAAMRRLFDARDRRPLFLRE